MTRDKNEVLNTVTWHIFQTIFGFFTFSLLNFLKLLAFISHTRLAPNLLCFLSLDWLKRKRKKHMIHKNIGQVIIQFSISFKFFNCILLSWWYENRVFFFFFFFLFLPFIGNNSLTKLLGFVRKNGQIPSSAEIICILLLFIKYLAIYYIFKSQVREIQIWYVTRISKIQVL